MSTEADRARARAWYHNHKERANERTRLRRLARKMPESAESIAARATTDAHAKQVFMLWANRFKW